MSKSGKLLLLTILAFIALSFTSCLKRQYEHKKWHKRPNRVYKFGGRHGQAGRRLSVRNRYRY